MRYVLLALAVLVAGSASAADCPGGRCRVAAPAVRQATRTTTRIVTAPVRTVRRVAGR
jgi:hypothetical protein